MSTRRLKTIDFVENIESDYENFDSSHNNDSCPSASSSFLTIDTSGSSFDGERRYFNGSSSPEDWTMSSAMCSISPMTPIGPTGMNSIYDAASWPRNQILGSGPPPTVVDSESFWPPHESFEMPNCVMSSFPNDNLPGFRPGYFNLHVRPRCPDPPLSRAVFAHATSINERSSPYVTDWLRLNDIDIEHAATVDPSATFQTILPSSPTSELEPVTPTKHRRDRSSMVPSSPLTERSTSVVTPQWNAGQTQYILPTDNHDCGHEQSLSLLLRSSQESDEPEEASSPCTNSQSKSGVDCEVVIAQNIYACSVAGCVDKNGKPKRFKRQEHKKRHEKTVHKKDSKFPCWVQTGGKACGREFTRRDNLNSHLKKTHGSRSTNQRNSYVATLDRNSEYFDERWRGPLTSDGLPIGHPRWPSIR